MGSQSHRLTSTAASNKKSPLTSNLSYQFGSLEVAPVFCFTQDFLACGMSPFTSSKSFENTILQKC